MNPKQLLLMYDILKKYCNSNSTKDELELLDVIRSMLLKKLYESDEYKLNTWIKNQNEKLAMLDSKELSNDKVEENILNDNDNEILHNYKYPSKFHKQKRNK